MRLYERTVRARRQAEWKLLSRRFFTRSPLLSPRTTTEKSVPSVVWRDLFDKKRHRREKERSVNGAKITSPLLDRNQVCLASHTASSLLGEQLLGRRLLPLTQPLFLPSSILHKGKRDKSSFQESDGASKSPKPWRKERGGMKGMEGSLRDTGGGWNSLSPGLTLRSSLLFTPLSSYDSSSFPLTCLFRSLLRRQLLPLSPLLVNTQDREKGETRRTLSSYPPLIVCLFVSSHTQHYPHKRRR